MDEPKLVFENIELLRLLNGEVSVECIVSRSFPNTIICGVDQRWSTIGRTPEPMMINRLMASFSSRLFGLADLEPLVEDWLSRGLVGTLNMPMGGSDCGKENRRSYGEDCKGSPPSDSRLYLSKGSGAEAMCDRDAGESKLAKGRLSWAENR